VAGIETIGEAYDAGWRVMVRCAWGSPSGLPRRALPRKGRCCAGFLAFFASNEVCCVEAILSRYAIDELSGASYIGSNTLIVASEHMEATMVKLSLLEGTPEEVIRVWNAMKGGAVDAKSATITDDATALTSATAAPVNGAGITPDLILRVLTRRELSVPIRKELKVLIKAGDKGLTTTETAKAVGIDRGQLAGVNGAFGRRIENTDGWPSGVRIIERYRDDAGVRRLRLPEAVRAALEKFDL